MGARIRQVILFGAVMILASETSCEIGKRCSEATGCCTSIPKGKNVIECIIRDRKNGIELPRKWTSRFDIMHFSNGSLITVPHNALNHLEDALFTDLKNITFFEGDHSHLEPRDRASPMSGNSMTIDGVGHVELRSNSLDGWRNKGSIIQIKNVESCHVGRSAFAKSTRIQQLLMENITSLVLEEDAFQATIGELLLRNVTLSDCPPGAFGGQVDHLLLLSVTVGSLRSGCVSPPRPWRALTVRRSSLGRVSRYGVIGSIADVNITESSISTVDSEGIQLTATNLSLSETEIESLRPGAMQVQADQAISLQRLTVSRLHEGAFRGLRVIGASNRGIWITALNVTRADFGSLMFADGVNVQVKELAFNILKDCSADEYAYTHSVYVESAWQPSLEFGGVSSRLHTAFQPLFECDFEAAIDDLYREGVDATVAH